MIRTKLMRMLAASLCAALCLSSVPVYAGETPNGQTEVQTDTMQEDVQQDGTEEGSSLNSETSEEPDTQSVYPGMARGYLYPRADRVSGRSENARERLRRGL